MMDGIDYLIRLLDDRLLHSFRIEKHDDGEFSVHLSVGRRTHSGKSRSLSDAIAGARAAMRGEPDTSSAASPPQLWCVAARDQSAAFRPNLYLARSPDDDDTDVDHYSWTTDFRLVMTFTTAKAARSMQNILPPPGGYAVSVAAYTKE